jgi:hypothetical protein
MENTHTAMAANFKYKTHLYVTGILTFYKTILLKNIKKGINAKLYADFKSIEKEF